MSKRGSNRPKGAPALPGAGRRPSKATIRNGTALMIIKVYPEGTADLGSGIATIEGIGCSRLIKIPQKDDSEIRILVIAEGK